MATLGGAVTNKFVIGNFELRVGPQEEAGNLTAEHSVGIVDRFAIQTQQESVDLIGMFPQEIIDTDIASQSVQLTATMREFSPRNLKMLTGNGVTGSSSSRRGTTRTAVVDPSATADSTYPSATLKSLVKAMTFNPGTDIAGRLCLINTTTKVVDFAVGTTTYGMSYFGTGATATTTKAIGNAEVTFTGKSTNLNLPVSGVPASANTYVVAAYGNSIQKLKPVSVGFITASAETLPNSATLIFIPGSSGTGDTNYLSIFLSSDTAQASSMFSDINVAVTGKTLVGHHIEFGSVASSTGIGTVIGVAKIAKAEVSAGRLVITLVASTTTTSLDATTFETATLFRLRKLASVTTSYNPFGGVSGIVGYTAALGTTSTVEIPYGKNVVPGDVITIGPLKKKFYVDELIMGAAAGNQRLKIRKLSATGTWEVDDEKTFTLSSVTEGYAGKLSLANMGSEKLEGTIYSKNTTTGTITLSFSSTLLSKEIYEEAHISLFFGDEGKVQYKTRVASVESVTANTLEVKLYDYDLFVILPESTPVSAFFSYGIGDLWLSNAITTLTLDDDAAYKDTVIHKGATLLIYDSGNNDEVTTVVVTEDSIPRDFAGALGNQRVINFSPALPFPVEHLTADNPYIVQLIDPINAGNVSKTEYFSASIVLASRDSDIPVTIDFWKVALASGVNMGLNTSEFASVDLVLDVLEPTSAEKMSGGVYYPISDILDKFPMFQYLSPN